MSKSKWAAAGLLVLALAGCGGAASQTSATASSGGPSATPASATSPAPAAAAGTVEFDLSFNSTVDVTCRLNQQWVDTGHGNPCSGYVIAKLANTSSANPDYQDAATNPSGFCAGESTDVLALTGAEAAQSTAGCEAALAYMASHPGGGEVHYPGSQAVLGKNA